MKILRLFLWLAICIIFSGSAEAMKGGRFRSVVHPNVTPEIERVASSQKMTSAQIAHQKSPKIEQTKASSHSASAELKSSSSTSQKMTSAQIENQKSLILDQNRRIKMHNKTTGACIWGSLVLCLGSGTIACLFMSCGPKAGVIGLASSCCVGSTLGATGTHLMQKEEINKQKSLIKSLTDKSSVSTQLEGFPRKKAVQILSTEKKSGNPFSNAQPRSTSGLANPPVIEVITR